VAVDAGRAPSELPQPARIAATTDALASNATARPAIWT
jgi:hypothetical protein